MTRIKKTPWLLAGLLLMGGGLAGCPKKPPLTSTPVETPTPASTPAPTPAPDVDAMMKGQAPEPTTGDLTASGCGSPVIHFDLDSSALKPDSISTLKTLAGCLSDHKSWTVVCEGNTDERGSTQYNLALGDRRAHAAAKYLIDAGVEKRRVSTVSYGTEKPIAAGHDETAWAQNRRTEFKVTAK